MEGEDASPKLASHSDKDIDSKTIKYMHRPAIAALPNGTFVAVWQAAMEFEGSSSQKLVISTSYDEVCQLY